MKILHFTIILLDDVIEFLHLQNFYNTTFNTLLSDSLWRITCPKEIEGEREGASDGGRHGDKTQKSQREMDATADAGVRVVIDAMEPYGREPGTRL